MQDNETFRQITQMAFTGFKAVGGFMGLLLLLGMARELRRFGVDPDEALKVKAGWTHYQLYTFTGAVLDPSKAIETVTQVHGGGPHQAISTSHSRHVHDQFFVRDARGTERSFKLVDVDLAVRGGHRLSAVWAIRKGKQRGDYVLFVNHTTGDRYFIHKGLRNMLKPHKWPALPLAALVLLLPAFLLGPEMFTLSSNQLQNLDAFLKILAVVAVIVFFLLRYVVIWIRMRRFKRRDAPGLIQRLAVEAQAW